MLATCIFAFFNIITFFPQKNLKKTVFLTERQKSQFSRKNRHKTSGNNIKKTKTANFFVIFLHVLE